MPPTTATQPSTAITPRDSPNQAQPSAETPIGSIIAITVTVVARTKERANSSAKNGTTVPSTTTQPSTNHIGTRWLLRWPSSETRSSSSPVSNPVIGLNRLSATVAIANDQRITR